MPRAIYTQHAAAFKHISAYALLGANNQLLARISFKFPKDGAGRLTCYFQLFGHPMVKGLANGYSYDKSTTAVINAIEQITNESAVLSDIKSALEGADGKSWDAALEHAEFKVIQAL